jgi:hypothetical protein
LQAMEGLNVQSKTVCHKIHWALQLALWFRVLKPSALNPQPSAPFLSRHISLERSVGACASMRAI